MRENLQFFDFKRLKFPRRISTILFFASPFLIIVLLLVAGCFQQPAADDFALFNFTVRYGFAGAINYFFHEHSSRYFSMPLLFVFAQSRFLINHYYIVTTAVFLLSFLIILLFLKNARIFFNTQIPGWLLIWVAAVAMLVFASSIMQISSLFYWWSASFTYLIPFDISLLYLVWFARFTIERKEKTRLKFFTGVLICSILLCGSNEEVAFFTGLSAFLYFLRRKIVFKTWDKFAIVLLLCDFGCSLILFFGPGNMERTADYGGNRQAVIYSLVSAGYQSLEMFAVIFSNPIFWVAFFAACIAHAFLREDIRIAIERKSHLFTELGILFISVFGFYFMVRAFGGWVLHARANNAVILIAVVTLLIVALRNGRFNPAFILQGGPVVVVKWAFILVILLNNFSQNLVKTIWAATYHNAVLANRVDQIHAARRIGLQSVVIAPYQQSLDSLLAKKYSPKWSQFIRGKLDFPPPDLYFIDDPWYPSCDIHYAEFYGIDTMIIAGKRIARFGLQ